MGNGELTEQWVKDGLKDHSDRVRGLEVWRGGVDVKLGTITKLQWAIIGVVIAGVIANIMFGG